MVSRASLHPLAVFKPPNRFQPSSRPVVTLSPPTLTVTESGSSAADSGWRISVMGFCPELARPFGAPTLILQEAGRRGRLSGGGGGLTAVRFSAPDTVWSRQREAFFSVQGLLRGDVTPAGWSQLSADSHCAASEVKTTRTRM